MSLRYPVAGHRLGNGMRVLVSADRLTPVAAVHVHHGGAAGGRAGAAPGCMFRYGRLDPRVLRMLMWAEADRMAAAGCPAGSAVLAVAGDVDAAQVAADAERYFGRLPASCPPAAGDLAPGPAACAGGGDELSWPAAEFGFRLPAYSVLDQSYFAAELALRIAAGGPGSRAYHALVRVARAACDVHVRFRPRAGASSSGIVAVLLAPGGGDVAGKVLAAGLRELAGCGPGEDELAGARVAAEQDALRVLASSTGRAFHLACLAGAYPSPSAINTVDDRIRSVTAAQVREAAAGWLRPEAAAPLACQPTWGQS